ncbi:MAG: transglycosylase SLT domain-containing protein, partial [Glaciecola sp.]
MSTSHTVNAPVVSDNEQLIHPVENVTESLSSIELPVELTDTQVPADITNLWEYIAVNATTLDAEHPRITKRQQWYLKHPQYMDKVAERARPFMHFIVQTLEENNLPVELALLPIVESAFDPFAYSHGSASGLWQFIPMTGKRFGMEQNWWYDGRRDVIKATQGAVKYLAYLHRYFDGNWYHALAAYNSGEGRVRRAIKKNERLNKPTDFWSLDLPQETRQYVPKL